MKFNYQKTKWTPIENEKSSTLPQARSQSSLVTSPPVTDPLEKTVE